jgi:nucleoside-diphosphate-sugar epimerase
VTLRCTLSLRTSEQAPTVESVHILNSLCSWGHVNPIGIRACYDEGKRVAETLTYGYHRQDNVDVRVVRIFNTYGTPQRAMCFCRDAEREIRPSHEPL